MLAHCCAKLKYFEIFDLSCSQGWQYGTVRSEFAYYEPRTFNCSVPAYRTSVQFLKRTVPTYRTLERYAFLSTVPSISLVKQRSI